MMVAVGEPSEAAQDQGWGVEAPMTRAPLPKATPVDSSPRELYADIARPFLSKLRDERARFRPIPRTEIPVIEAALDVLCDIHLANEVPKPRFVESWRKAKRLELLRLVGDKLRALAEANPDIVDGDVLIDVWRGRA